jgi:hypothetical protein
MITPAPEQITEMLIVLLLMYTIPVYLIFCFFRRICG